MEKKKLVVMIGLITSSHFEENTLAALTQAETVIMLEFRIKFWFLIHVNLSF